MVTLIHVAWLAVGTIVPLSGTVVDAAGRPVAGASVWLGDTIATNKGPEVLSSAVTDDRGHFVLERADDLAGRGAMWSPTLWAYKPGFRVAFLEFKQNLPKADVPVRLVLGPPASTSLRVLLSDGKPAAGARVRLVHVNIESPRPPDKLFDRVAATTDTEGRATLDGFALADIFALDVTAPGQLVQCLAIDPDTGTVALRPVGRLKARIVADDPKDLRGWTVTASSRPAEPGYVGPYTTHWVRKTTADDGLVEFPTLAVGEVLWEIKAPDGSNCLAIKQPAAMIRAGELAEAEIKVVRAVRVEGTVVEEPGAAPISGVTIDLLSLTHFTGRVNQSVTDAQGRFSTVVLPGTARFSFSLHDMPKSHFLPSNIPHWADFEVKQGAQRQTFDPPRLRRAAQVKGRVVDEQGQPAAAVTVEGTWISAEYGSNPNSIRAVTNAQGEFVLGSIAPKSVVKISASWGLVAKSDPVTVPAAGESEPITLLLQQRPTLALSGRVLKADGQPLAGAAVQVKIRSPNQRASSGAVFAFEGAAAVRTGRDGQFLTPAQLPIEQEYRVLAQATGYEPGESSWIVAPPAAVPDIRLRQSVGTRAVTGRVVDSAGKPVAKAEVYQSGDGPRKTGGTTDDDGRFRVAGIPNAPALLFVSRSGYHFLGRRVDPGDQSVELALLRLDESPAAPLRSVAALVPREEERAIARALIAEAQKEAGGSHARLAGMQVPEITALVDPDRVVEMIENQVLAAEPGLLAALAVARFDDNPQKALEFLSAIDQPGLASNTTLSLFDRLGAMGSPDFRRELLERAARRARQIDEPGEAATQLARVADRWLDLGDANQGKACAREAQVLAEKLGQQASPAPRDDLALALARVDLPAALKLLERAGQEAYRLEMLRTAIASRIATTNPVEARRLVDLIEEQRRPMARRVVCLRMAAKDLAAARAFAAEDHNLMVEALLPAAAAQAQARSDPESARTLLRESVERLATLGDSPAFGPSPAVALARLLPLAHRIDPARAPDDLWLALSLRAPLPAVGAPNAMMNQVRQQYVDLAELAMLVVRYDRSAAEAVFAPVAARLAATYEENWGLGNEGPAIFRAAGAFDARVARTLLDGLPEDPAPPAGQSTGQPMFRHRTKVQARIALASTLGLPPGLRLREPFRKNGDDWFKELED